MEEERNGYLVGRGMFSTRHLISYSVAWEMLDSIQETLLYLSTENILSVKLKLVFYISYLIWGPFTPPRVGESRYNSVLTQNPKYQKTVFTSMTMVAISRVGSNMRFSCFSGPIRKQVL